jgi:hypothetical protein
MSGGPIVNRRGTQAAILVAAVALSAVFAWQGVRTYRGEIDSSFVNMVLDLFRAREQAPKTWMFVSIIAPLTHAAAKSAAILLWVMLATYLPGLCITASRVARIGAAAYRNLVVVEAGQASEPKTRNAGQRQHDSQRGGVLDGLLHLFAAIFLLGVLVWFGLFAIVVFDRADAYLADIGITWFQIGDAMAVGIMVLIVAGTLRSAWTAWKWPEGAP